MANLGSALATLRIREAIRKISSGKKSSLVEGRYCLAHKLKAKSASNYAASLNLDDALAAFELLKFPWMK